jgi:alkyldihydroxyacetonephosphate synthase
VTATAPRRKWWGWGSEDDGVDPAAYERLRRSLGGALGVTETGRIEPVDPASIELPPPRFALPATLAAFATDDRLDRIAHASGKAYVDLIRAVRGNIDNPPDWVAYPRDEADVAATLRFAASEGIAVIPYGGGSSVVGGVEPPPRDRVAGTITLDLRRLDRVVRVDPVARLAEVEAGVFGPALEAGLKPSGLTLRHYPQSFEFSTVGGWIATRASGHFATGPTRIDPLVAGARLLTTQGVIDTSELGLSGAGPSAVGLILGSEGALGVITRAWLRVRPVPTQRASTVVEFEGVDRGVEAVRALAQSGLEPASCRLVSPMEAALTGLGAGRAPVLLLGFESHDRSVERDLARGVAICEDVGGREITDDGAVRAAPTAGDGAADRWRRWFLQAPYLRDRLALDGLIVETFETATTWDRFTELQANVIRATEAAIAKACARGFVTWRLTAAYPDGVAPYYTVIASADPGHEIEQWTAIKQAASDAVLTSGGTITHHHAVGKVHRPWFERERGDAYIAALRALKRELDPACVMNPDTLVAIAPARKSRPSPDRSLPAARSGPGPRE